MSRHINHEVMTACVQYVQENYKFKDYLEKYNLLEGCMYEGANRVAICCPFHEDDDPSCKIDLDKNIYNSFCCTHKGNLIGFLSSYSTEVLNRPMGYLAMLESLLINDPVMQLRVGSKTIYSTDKVTLGELEMRRLRNKVKFSYVKKESMTFMELSSYLKNLGDVSKIKMSITLMQTGLTAKEIYNIILEKDDEKERTKGLEIYDIRELTSDD